MEYVIKEVKVSPGEAILTSGQDRIFPKDLPVGTVEEVSPDPHSPFYKIVVKPAAHLDRLEEVLVLLTRQELPSSAGALAPLPALPAPAAPKASAPVARPAAPAAVSAPAKQAVPVPATQSVPPAAPAAPPAAAIPPAPAAGPAAGKEQQ
jgi:rod shape-determining protein MreC